jgi:lipopolysaccharide export system ATP-binding protein
MTLTVSHLYKTIGQKRILSDISLNFEAGQATGILGPNGAGKTTLFYMIVGLLPCKRGQIFLNGEDITKQPLHQRARLGMGYLPQESSIFQSLTVEQNIKMALQLTKHPQPQKALDGLLDDFSLTHLRTVPAPALSGGEKRRVELARTLATQPKFVFLDEPLAAIDPIAVEDIRELIAHLKDRGIGVVITDHNVRETLKIIDHTYILYNGQIVCEGDENTIINNPHVKDIYLGSTF